MKQKFLRPGTLLFALFFFACSQPAADSKEKQPVRPSKINTNPSSAYLSPQQSLKTMHMPAGYHLELVASEPMIQEPVAIVWDGNGGMYVAEMRSYMQDIEGTGEHLPVCRITRLEDTNEDGVMDKSSVFIDSLVLPRMMLTLSDQLVVNETYSYNLYSYRDTNGDGKADEKKRVYHNGAADNANLEHQRSGLVCNIDNWIYMTTSAARFRYNNGMLKADSLADGTGGQWGLGNDDYGRLFFSSAGGETPALEFQQNPVYGRLNLDSQREDNFDAVWPVIGTSDVQGGKIHQREEVRSIILPPTDKSVYKMIELLFDTAEELLAKQSVSNENISGIGISCGGPLNSKLGIILSPPNLAGWDNIPIVDMAEKRFGKAVLLQNDANACAIAEWKYGAGKGYNNVIFLTFRNRHGCRIDTQWKTIFRH